MSSRHKSPRARRGLLVAGATAAVVLLPGAAWADTPPGPDPDPVTGAVSTLGDAIGGVLSGGTGSGTTSGTGSAGTGSGAGTGGGAGTGSGAGTGGGTTGTGAGAGEAPSGTTGTSPLPTALDPSQLTQVLTALGISQSCVDSVQQDIEQAVTDLPATLEGLLGEISSQLPGLPSQVTDPTGGGAVSLDALEQFVSSGGTAKVAATSDPTEVPVVVDLQRLLEDLIQKCVPKPSSTTPPATTAPTSPSSPVAGQAPATQQPVSYLGYAPTGGSGPGGSSGSTPLAAVGAVLLVSGSAGVGWYRVRSRAAQAQD